MLSQRIKHLIDDNRREILSNKHLHRKIENIYNEYVCYLMDIDFETYKSNTLKSIENNDINSIILYMKKPCRQNVYEPIQIELMEKILNKKFKRYNDETFENTKSFDGISEDNTTIIQCKYIRQSGGSQDNQFNDLIRFNVKQDKYENYLVISGEYGIQLMEKYIKENVLYEHTHVVFMGDNIRIVDNNKDVMKLYNKFYSINDELIHDIQLNKYIDTDTIIYEPYYGDGSLLEKLLPDEKTYKSLIINDITEITKLPKTQTVCIMNTDSLMTSLWKPNENVFIITNPPYTSKNKLDKETKNKYNTLLTPGIDDLYQIFIKQLIVNVVFGGFIIIPSNFIFGKHNKLFKEFTKIYAIDVLNIYEKKVFENTTQSVISLLFYNMNKFEYTKPKVYLHTKNDEIIHIKNKHFNKILSNTIQTLLPLENSKDITITRSYNKPDNLKQTNIRISLLDYNMGAIYVNNMITDKISDRAFMSVCVNKDFTKDEELKIIDLFNQTLNDIRSKTYSLILTSYREFDRKRLTFAETIHILKYVIEKI